MLDSPLTLLARLTGHLIVGRIPLFRLRRESELTKLTVLSSRELNEFSNLGKGAWKMKVPHEMAEGNR